MIDSFGSVHNLRNKECKKKQQPVSQPWQTRNLTTSHESPWQEPLPNDITRKPEPSVRDITESALFRNNLH